MTSTSPRRVRIALLLLAAAALCQIPALLFTEQLALIDGASPDKAIHFYLSRALAGFAAISALFALPLLRQSPRNDPHRVMVTGTFVAIFLLATVDGLYANLYAAYALHRITQHDLVPYFNGFGRGLLNLPFPPLLVQLSAFPVALLTFHRLDALADASRASLVRLLTPLVLLVAIILLMLHIENPRDFMTFNHERFGLPSRLDNGHPLPAIYPTLYYLLFAIIYCPLAALRLSRTPPCHPVPSSVPNPT